MPQCWITWMGWILLITYLSARLEAMVLVLLRLVVSVSAECTQSSLLPGMWSGSQYRYRSLLSWNQGVSPPQRLTGWRTSKRTRPSHLLPILTAPCLSKETVLDLPPDDMMKTASIWRQPRVTAPNYSQTCVRSSQSKKPRPVTRTESRALYWNMDGIQLSAAI